MSRTRVLSRRHLVPGGLLAGLALTGSAFSLGSPHHSALRSARPQTVAQAVALPSVVPAHTRRASRGAARSALPRFVTRDVAVGRSFSGDVSWYGGSFQGRRTASGERFDARALTAASRTLAFGTRLRVCRRSGCVVVRVNDRGPYVASRVLDLSKAARDRLGRFGVARVTATPITSRRLPAPGRSGARFPVRPALPIHPTAPPAQAVLVAETVPGTRRGADARLAAGTVLSAGSSLSWLRRRRRPTG